MITYCDSSALVALLRPDEGEREPLVAGALREASAAVALEWICPLEVSAAIHRTLDARARRTAETRWWALWSRLVAVAFDEAVYGAALEIAREHRLRTLDALHLAAAARIGSERLLTFDTELAAASRRVGIEPVGA